MGSSVGTVFLPLRACSNTKKENSHGGGNDTDCSGELKGIVSALPRGDSGSFGNTESQYVDNGGGGECDAGGKKGFFAVLRPCNNKRKDRVDTGVDGDRFDAGSSSGFRAVKASNKAIEAKSLGMFLFLKISMCGFLDF